MIINLEDVYDQQGNVNEFVADLISGSKQVRTLMNGLSITFQSLAAKANLVLSEVAKPGIYISLLSPEKIADVSNLSSWQLSLLESNKMGTFEIAKGETKTLVQVHISRDQLAKALDEDSESVSTILKQSIHKVGQNNIIRLPISTEMQALTAPILQAQNKTSLSLLSQVYSLVFSTLEHIQMLNHLVQCQDCQNRLFQAQNIVEAEATNTLDEATLAESVGLNLTALELGIYHISGISIQAYIDQIRAKLAAALVRQNTLSRSEMAARTGVAEDQFDALFLRHFGVPSVYYAQVH